MWKLPLALFQSTEYSLENFLHRNFQFLVIWDILINNRREIPLAIAGRSHVRALLIPAEPGHPGY